jgi:hypothetical protein
MKRTEVVTLLFMSWVSSRYLYVAGKNRMEATVGVAVEIFGLSHPLLLEYKSVCTVINQKL